MKKILYALAILVMVLQPGPGILAASAAPQAIDQIFYVVPGGTGDCSAWGASACELQTALTNPSLAAGDEIWVRYGTYKPTTGTDRIASFQLKSGVGVYGGFDGNETLRGQRNPAEHLTTLSGELGLAETFDNSLHVVYALNVDASAVLDGFTINAGHADVSGIRTEWGGRDSATAVARHIGELRRGAGTVGYVGDVPVQTYLTWQEQRYWLQRSQGIVLYPELNRDFAFGAPMSAPPLKDMLKAWRHVTRAADPFLDSLTTKMLKR